jgi:hypothetical protein
MSSRLHRSNAALATLIAICLAVLALMFVAPSAQAQRGAVDNPYPQTKKTPTPAPTSVSAQTKHYSDSLKLAYPPSSKNEPCWRFVEPEKIQTGDAYFCYRDRGSVLQDASTLGNLATYYRGKWDNVTEEGRVAPIMVEWNEAKKSPRSTAIITGLGMSPPAVVKH